MKPEEKEDQAIAIVPKKNPREVVAFGQEAAKVLKDVVTQAGLVKKISGNDYMMFEGWQTVARFYGATVGIEWTKPVKETAPQEELSGAIGERIIGFEARAYVKDKEGKIISTADSYCGRDESMWNKRPKYERGKKIGEELVPQFALRSMAQTRASAKALRQVYAWVVVLAGYKATPAEEMAGITVDAKIVTGDARPEKKCLCYECKKEISDKVAKFSMDKYKKPLCMPHQKELQAELDKTGAEPEEAVDVEDIE